MPPPDTLQDLRTEMMLHLIEAGITVEAQHHEVATAGQCEIDMKFSPLVEMADKVMKYKYILKNTAKKHGKCVTFMPKPIFGDNGTGMHVHVSLWKNNVNLFAGSGYAGLSDIGLYAIGGLIKHAPSICAFTNPTTNSYKRLVPGFEAPVNLAYSRRNRSAAIRIPMYSSSPKAKRVEFRCPDPSSNPYFAFAVMLMAVIDGIKNKIKPGEPLDRDIYDMEPEELAKVPKAPGSLEESINNLERDHEFLMQGEVFTRDVIRTWVDYKRARRSTPSACGRTRMSFICISIFDSKPAGESSSLRAWEPLDNRPHPCTITSGAAGMHAPRFATSSFPASLTLTGQRGFFLSDDHERRCRLRRAGSSRSPRAAAGKHAARL